MYLFNKGNETQQQAEAEKIQICANSKLIKAHQILSGILKEDYFLQNFFQAAIFTKEKNHHNEFAILVVKTKLNIVGLHKSNCRSR